MLFCSWVKASSIFYQLWEDKQAKCASVHVCALILLNFKTKPVKWKQLASYMSENVLQHMMNFFFVHFCSVNTNLALGQGHHVIYWSLMRLTVI